MSVIAAFGAILVILAVALFWLFLPRNGRTHPWMALPFVGSAVPLAIVTAVAIGLTMVAEVLF